MFGLRPERPRVAIGLNILSAMHLEQAMDKLHLGRDQMLRHCRRPRTPTHQWLIETRVDQRCAPITADVTL